MNLPREWEKIAGVCEEEPDWVDSRGKSFAGIRAGIRDTTQVHSQATLPE